MTSLTLLFWIAAIPPAQTPATQPASAPASPSGPPEYRQARLKAINAASINDYRLRFKKAWEWKSWVEGNRVKLGEGSARRYLGDKVKTEDLVVLLSKDGTVYQEVWISPATTRWLRTIDRMLIAADIVFRETAACCVDAQWQEWEPARQSWSRLLKYLPDAMTEIPGRWGYPMEVGSLYRTIFVRITDDLRKMQGTDNVAAARALLGGREVFAALRLHENLRFSQQHMDAVSAFQQLYESAASRSDDPAITQEASDWDTYLRRTIRALDKANKQWEWDMALSGQMHRKPPWVETRYMGDWTPSIPLP